MDIIVTLAVVLLVLWLFGMTASSTLGWFIHILLVIAIILTMVRVIEGRSPI